MYGDTVLEEVHQDLNQLKLVLLYMAHYLGI